MLFTYLIRVDSRTPLVYKVTTKRELDLNNGPEYYDFEDVERIDPFDLTSTKISSLQLLREMIISSEYLDEEERDSGRGFKTGWVKCLNYIQSNFRRQTKESPTKLVFGSEVLNNIKTSENPPTLADGKILMMDFKEDKDLDPTYVVVSKDNNTITYVVDKNWFAQPVE